MKKTTAINLYLLEIKRIVDTLAAIGSPMDTEAHIDAIFDGLPEEYDGFVTSVLSRSEQYSVSQIESLLMAQEARLERHKRNDSQVHMIISNNSPNTRANKINSLKISNK